MKNRKSLVAAIVLTLMTTALLSIPGSAGAAQFKTYVGCDSLAASPTPAHVCQLGDFPGAYIEAEADTEYEICAEFPNEEFICREEQLAKAGVLTLNEITTDELGLHFVAWYVGGVEIGSWSFRIDAPPPPPIPAPAPVVLPTPPAVAPPPSAACLKGQQQVDKLKGQLRKATARKRKLKIRSKLKNARATVKSAC